MYVNHVLINTCITNRNQHSAEADISLCDIVTCQFVTLIALDYHMAGRFRLMLDDCDR